MEIAALVSGGVDSSVVVHQLKEAGYDPTIFYIRIGMEDKDGYIIRLYNGQFHEEESDTLVFTQNIKKAYYVDLKEEYADSIEVVDNTIQVKPLTHCKFTTIYVETIGKKQEKGDR